METTNITIIMLGVSLVSVLLTLIACLLVTLIIKRSSHNDCLMSNRLTGENLAGTIKATPKAGTGKLLTVMGNMAKRLKKVVASVRSMANNVTDCKGDSFSSAAVCSPAPWDIAAEMEHLSSEWRR